MKSNRIIPLMLLLALSTCLSAQMRFGFKTSIGIIPAGEETNFAARKNNGPADFKIVFEQADPVLGIGVFVQEEIGWLYFQSDLMFTNYKTQFQLTSFQDTDDIFGTVNETWRYFDWQVMAGLYKNGYRLGVGPIMHIVGDHESNFSDLSLYNEKIRRVTYGFSFGVGYNLGLFSFDMKYERAFRSIGDHIWYDEFKSDFDGRPDALTLAVGFGF